MIFLFSIFHFSIPVVANNFVTHGNSPLLASKEKTIFQFEGKLKLNTGLSSQIKNASERTRSQYSYLDVDKLLLILTRWSAHGHTSIVVSDYNSISPGIETF